MIYSWHLNSLPRG